MSDFKFKLDKSGVRTLLKSPEMQSICNDYATSIKLRAGEGYEVQKRTYPERSGAVVNATTPEAKKDNSDNNTLLKCL